MPRNLGDFEIHWTDAHGNDVFEVSLQTEFADVRVYVAGGNGVPAAGPRPSWLAFLAAEWVVRRRHRDDRHSTRCAASTRRTRPSSAPRRRGLVQLSNEPMDGGLYYWAATARRRRVRHLPPRHEQARPAGRAVHDDDQTGGRCVACHVLSRDGTKMAITYDGGDGRATIVDVATHDARSADSRDAGTSHVHARRPQLPRGASTACSRCATRPTQAALATMPAAGYVTHPDLSADGTKLVYVRADAPGSDWAFTGGTIYTRTLRPGHERVRRRDAAGHRRRATTSTRRGRPTGSGCCSTAPTTGDARTTTSTRRCGSSRPTAVAPPIAAHRVQPGRRRAHQLVGPLGAVRSRPSARTTSRCTGSPCRRSATSASAASTRSARRTRRRRRSG